MRVLLLCAALAVGCAFSPRGSSFLFRHRGRRLLSAADDADKEHERKWLSLEAEIRSAVKEERYVDAAKATDELIGLEIDDAGAVLGANSAFYRAFSERNIDAMATLCDSEWASCTHPNQKPVLGYTAVMETWEKMLLGAAAAKPSIDVKSLPAITVEPSAVQCRVRGLHAVVTCLERATMRGHVGGNTMHALNVFKKVHGKWRLVHHHASPGQAGLSQGLPRGQAVSGDLAALFARPHATSGSGRPEGQSSEGRDASPLALSPQQQRRRAQQEQQQLLQQRLEQWGQIEEGRREGRREGDDDADGDGDDGEGKGRLSFDESGLVMDQSSMAFNFVDDDSGQLEWLRQETSGLRGILAELSDDLVRCLAPSRARGELSGLSAALFHPNKHVARIDLEDLIDGYIMDIEDDDDNDDDNDDDDDDDDDDEEDDEEDDDEDDDDDDDDDDDGDMALWALGGRDHVLIELSPELLSRLEPAFRRGELSSTEVTTVDPMHLKTASLEGKEQDGDEGMGAGPSEEEFGVTQEGVSVVSVGDLVLGNLKKGLDRAVQLSADLATDSTAALTKEAKGSTTAKGLTSKGNKGKGAAPQVSLGNIRVSGADDARIEAKRGLGSAVVRRVSLRLFDEATGTELGFGWSRDTATQRVVHVTPGGQAARAGVEAGWVVTHVADTKLDGSNDRYDRALAMAKAAGAKAVSIALALPMHRELAQLPAGQGEGMPAGEDGRRVDAAIGAANGLPDYVLPSWAQAAGTDSRGSPPPSRVAKSPPAVAPLEQRALGALRLLARRGLVTPAQRVAFVSSMVAAKAANAARQANAAAVASASAGGVGSAATSAVAQPVVNVPSLFEVSFDVLLGRYWGGKAAPPPFWGTPDKGPDDATGAGGAAGGAAGAAAGAAAEGGVASPVAASGAWGAAWVAEAESALADLAEQCAFLAGEQLQ